MLFSTPSNQPFSPKSININAILLSDAVASLNTKGLLPYGRLETDSASLATAKAILLALQSRSDLRTEPDLGETWESMYSSHIEPGVNAVISILSDSTSTRSCDVRRYAKQLWLSTSSRSLIDMPISLASTAEEKVLGFLGAVHHLDSSAVKAISDSAGEVNSVLKVMRVFVEAIVDSIDNP